MLTPTLSSAVFDVSYPQRGMSLVELAIAIAIAGFAMVAVLPSISVYFGNSKLRSAAQSYFSGAQAARTEAIRRNTPVQFVLAAAPVTVANVGTVTLGTTAQNWAVRLPAVAPATGFTLLDAKSVGEGRAESVEVDSTAASVTFNGLGMAGNAMTVDFTNTQGGECAPTGPMRCLRLVVSVGGQVRLCDPQAAASDSRRC